MRGDIRGAAVPGSSPGSPHAVDRVDIATGGGADGEGELVPPPLSPTLQSPCFSLPALLRGIPIRFCRPPHPARAFAGGYPYASAGSPRPARAFAGIPMHFSGSPHPTRAFGAPPPPPPRGRGPCVAIPGGKSVSGVEPAGNRIRLFPTYPHAVDRVDIATGGEADGEGELVPPPLSLTLQPPCFSSASPPCPHLPAG